MDYNNKPITRFGYFDEGANGSLKDLKKQDALSVIRWVPYFIEDGHSPTVIRDLIEVILQAMDCVGRAADITFVIEYKDGPIKRMKDYNLFEE